MLYAKSHEMKNKTKQNTLSKRSRACEEQAEAKKRGITCEIVFENK
jgi:hypothetical protein